MFLLCLPWTKCTEHTNTSAFPLPKHARPGSCPRAMSRAVIDCSFSHALRRSKVSKGSFVCSHTSQLVSSHCCDLPTFCCLVPRASNADPESPPGLQFPIVRFGKLRGPLGSVSAPNSLSLSIAHLHGERSCLRIQFFCLPDLQPPGSMSQGTL